MRAVVIASCASAVAAVSYKVHEIPSFESYCKDNSLNYAGPEKEKRKAIYEQSVKTVTAQNSKKGGLWKANINEFSAMSDDEKLAFTGYMKTTGKSAARGMAPAQKPHAADLPESVDWNSHLPSVVTATKSQGSCGSCWAFASTAVMESHIAIATGHLIDFATQQVTSCTPNPDECGGSGGCFGATSQLAFDYVAKNGLASQWTWPYQSGMTKQSMGCQAFGDGIHDRNVPIAGITGFHQLPQNDAQALMEAVTIGPVAVSVAAGSWHAYSEGIFDGCSTERPILNHAVVMNGYGLDNGVAYWKIRNSWGTSWGELGYIRLQRFPDEEPCGIDDEPLDGYSCKNNPPDTITACGMCGVLSDSAYPTGAYVGKAPEPDDPALHNKTTSAPSLVQARKHRQKQAREHEHQHGLPDGSDGAAFIQMPLDKEL